MGVSLHLTLYKLLAIWSLFPLQNTRCSTGCCQYIISKTVKQLTQLTLPLLQLSDSMDSPVIFSTVTRTIWQPRKRRVTVERVGLVGRPSKQRINQMPFQNIEWLICPISRCHLQRNQSLKHVSGASSLFAYGKILQPQLKSEHCPSMSKPPEAKNQARLPSSNISLDTHGPWIPYNFGGYTENTPLFGAKTWYLGSQKGSFTQPTTVTLAAGGSIQKTQARPGSWCPNKNS